MAAITIYSDFGAQKNKVSHCFHCFSICHEVLGLNAMILVFWMLSLTQLFTLLFHFHQEALQFFFTFCHKGGIINISEVIDIPPSNLDETDASSSPAFHMMYSA